MKKIIQLISLATILTLSTTQVKCEWIKKGETKDFKTIGNGGWALDKNGYPWQWSETDDWVKKDKIVLSSSQQKEYALADSTQLKFTDITNSYAINGNKFYSYKERNVQETKINAWLMESESELSFKVIALDEKIADTVYLVDINNNLYKNNVLISNNYKFEGVGTNGWALGNLEKETTRNKIYQYTETKKWEELGSGFKKIGGIWAIGDGKSDKKNEKAYQYEKENWVQKSEKTFKDISGDGWAVGKDTFIYRWE